MNLVYGNPDVLLDGGLLSSRGLNLGATVHVTSKTKPFAFTSLTVDATFSRAGASELLRPGFDNPMGAHAFLTVLHGDPTFFGIYNGRGNPSQLLTLEPLTGDPAPGDPVTDKSSTLALAGLSAVGLMLCRRKLIGTPVKGFISFHKILLKIHSDTFA
jgi:hypothetical protein